MTCAWNLFSGSSVLSLAVRPLSSLTVRGKTNRGQEAAGRPEECPRLKAEAGAQPREMVPKAYFRLDPSSSPAAFVVWLRTSTQTNTKTAG